VKYLLVWFIILFSSSGISLDAQSFGIINFGLNYANEGVMGLQGGLLINTPLNEINETLSIETGMFISRKGHKFTIESQEYWVIQQKVKPVYATIPFLLRKGFVDNGTKGYIRGGVYLGFGIVGRVKEIYIPTVSYIKATIDAFPFGPSPPDIPEDINSAIPLGDLTDYIKRFDSGFIFSLGVEGDVFEFGMSFEQGFIDIISENSKGRNKHLKNSVFSFLLGIRILSTN